jgi:PhzF family phenazine biosynthesis protein
MQVQVEIVSAFIDGDSGGNLAGVVLDADALSNQQKLAVAQAVGLSETAFVSRSALADFKLDFFTPQRQIAHCGHATIASFNLLQQQGRVPAPATSKETIDGIRAVNIEGSEAFMQQRAPKYQSVAQDHNQILAALGLSASQLIAKPLRVDTGNGFIVVALDSPASLAQLTPDQQQLAALSDKYELVGFYVFCRQSNNPGRDASARMFAPRYGIAEESATGMAARPLACYLHDKLGVSKTDYLIEQGYAMQPASPSVISVRLQLQQGAISSVFAGGSARRVDGKTVTI